MKKFYCSCVWFQCVLCFLWKLFLCVLCWHQTWNDFFRCCSSVAGDRLNSTMLCLVNFSEPISQNLKFHNMLNRPWSQVKVKSAWSVCRSFFPCCKPITKKTWCWFSFLLRLPVKPVEDFKKLSHILSNLRWGDASLMNHLSFFSSDVMYQQTKRRQQDQPSWRVVQKARGLRPTRHARSTWVTQ